MFDERIAQEQADTGKEIDINHAAASYSYDAAWSMALALNHSIDVLKNGKKTFYPFSDTFISVLNYFSWLWKPNKKLVTKEWSFSLIKF